MIKFITLAIFAIFLSSCNKWSILSTFGVRKFKVGDCIYFNYNVEKWDSPRVKKIIDISDRSYRVQYGRHLTSNLKFGYEEGIYEKISCENFPHNDLLP